MIKQRPGDSARNRLHLPEDGLFLLNIQTFVLGSFCVEYLLRRVGILVNCTKVLVETRVAKKNQEEYSRFPFRV